MAKSLPVSLDLNAAVRRAWQMQGELLLSDLDRIPAELISSKEVSVKYEILFRHSQTVLGEAIIRIEAMLELICQRSLETFDFLLQTNKVIGFISEIEDEEKLEDGVSPSWAKDMQVDPKALLEDEILLLIPVVPIKPGAELNSQYLTDRDDNEPESEETQNPFAALEQLKNH